MCIIQAVVKTEWLHLTVSYLVAGTHKQYYKLTTPTGSRGSKNKRPNNTHLNLGGTQMSPIFLELRQVFVTSSSEVE